MTRSVHNIYKSQDIQSQKTNVLPIYHSEITTRNSEELEGCGMTRSGYWAAVLILFTIAVIFIWLWMTDRYFEYVDQFKVNSPETTEIMSFQPINTSQMILGRSYISIL
jgi:hypothetical protein